MKPIILFVSDICFYLNMKYALKRDVVWLESLPIVDHFATIILTGDDGHLVEVTASLLLAVSSLMRSILSEHLPPAYSQCFLSLPSATEEVLKDVRNILATGEAADAHENRMEEVRQVFELLGVDALLFSCHSESINVGHVLDWEDEDFADELVKVETEYLGNFPHISQKKELSFSKVVTSTVFKEEDKVDGTGAFEIKLEPDVAHLVNDYVHIFKEVPHKWCECKYDEAELTNHGKIIKFLCQNCTYMHPKEWGLEYHCRSTGHVANKDAAAICKQCDYIAEIKEDLFKTKVYVPTAEPRGGPPGPATGHVVKKDKPKGGFVGSGKKTAKIAKIE